mgnify:CR=1 FL=1
MFEKLEPRERLFLFGGGALILVLLLVFFGLMIRRARVQVEEDVAQRRAMLNQIAALKSSIDSLEDSGAPPNRSQFVASVNSLLSQYGLNVSDFKDDERTDPTGTTYVVNMRLRAVKLDDLMRYLHAIEYGRRTSASIESIRISRSVSSQEVYDVKLQLTLTVARGQS